MHNISGFLSNPRRPKILVLRFSCQQENRASNSKDWHWKPLSFHGPSTYGPICHVTIRNRQTQEWYSGRVLSLGTHMMVVMGFRQENSLRANFYIRAVLANFGWETPDIRKKHNEPFQNGIFFLNGFWWKMWNEWKGIGRYLMGVWTTTKWLCKMIHYMVYWQTQNLTKQIRAEKITCGPEFLPGQKLRTASG